MTDVKVWCWSGIFRRKHLGLNTNGINEEYLDVNTWDLAQMKEGGLTTSRGLQYQALRLVVLKVRILQIEGRQTGTENDFIMLSFLISLRTPFISVEELPKHLASCFFCLMPQGSPKRWDRWWSMIGDRNRVVRDDPAPAYALMIFHFQRSRNPL